MCLRNKAILAILALILLALSVLIFFTYALPKIEAVVNENIKEKERFVKAYEKYQKEYEGSKVDEMTTMQTLPTTLSSSSTVDPIEDVADIFRQSKILQSLREAIEAWVQNWQLKPIRSFV